ncbi:MAG TPA: TniB family NTP-binding protein [Candidatus Lokiarchaeia archaeon]|nr:TniB family NTP-binding protein [Candidatus Lokiarchaeia archaeon]
MTLVYNHLNEETNKIMEIVGGLEEKQSIESKKKWTRQTHFVYHENARLTIDCVNDIFDQVTSVENTNELTEINNSIAIIGGTGTGKTETALEIMRQYPSSFTNERETVPIARAILRDGITGLTGLYYSLLEALGSPYACPPANKRTVIRVAHLESQLLWDVKAAGVKIFIIDEFQHLLGRNQQALVNQLKRTLQYSKIAFIPMGTFAMRELLELDPQLADRCAVKPYTKFHNWKSDKEFLEFLAAYEKYLPFPESSNLNSHNMANKIYEKMIRFEDAATGEILTYAKFKDWVDENKKRIIKQDPRGIKGWNSISVNDDLYDNALLDEQIKNFIDPENQLAIRTNLRHVVEYLKKLTRLGLVKKIDRITEELIDETPF